MKQTFRFLEDESGQDLIEYSLLVAFIAVASAATLSERERQQRKCDLGLTRVGQLKHSHVVASS